MLISSVCCHVGDRNFDDRRTRHHFTSSPTLLATIVHGQSLSDLVLSGCWTGLCVYRLYHLPLSWRLSPPSHLLSKENLPHRSGRNQSALLVGHVLLCYLAFYVGINRLLMMLVPRKQPSRMVGAVAMMVAILLLSHLVPLFLVYYANDYREFAYDWHQALNIIWTVREIVDNNSVDLGAGMVIITLCAIGVFGLNLLLCTRDVMLVRVGLPPRVREEESGQATYSHTSHRSICRRLTPMDRTLNCVVNPWFAHLRRT